MSYLYFCRSVPARTALWFLATLLAVSLAGAQPMPVQDVFPQPYYSTVYNGSRYLWASSAATGTELWKSDGTAAGTTLVKDINPGPEGNGLGGFTVFNGKLYFGAGEAENGFEPWVSDGTAAGTLLLEDLNPYYVYEPDGGPASSAPGDFQVVNGDLYFQAAVLPNDNPHEETTARASNYEMPATLDALFAVRGATGKLDRVFTSQPSRQGIGASISSLTNINGTLYFTTYSSWPTITPENKLYASDGTTTRLIKDFARTRWEQPSELTPYNGAAYFVADDVVSGKDYFGHTAPGGIGSRKFHVNLEGARKLTDYDVFARAGGALRVAQETFRVTVSDGTLNVAFLKGSADNPAAKAIEVLPAGSALTINAGGAVGQVQGTAITDTQGRVLLPNGHRASGENGLEIGTESLPKGLFLLRIQAGEQTQTLKFIKQ